MADRAEIFTASSGRISARVFIGTETVRHLHSTVAPEDEHRYFEDLVLWGDIVVLVGTGLGYHLSKAIATLPRHSVVVAVERYPDLARECLRSFLSHLGDRLVLVTGGEPEDVLSKARAVLHSRPGASLQEVKHPASYEANTEYYRRITNALVRRAVPASGTGGGILLMFGSHFLEAEIRDAAKELGGALAEFGYGAYPTAVAFESELQKVLARARPEAILSVNMKGFDSEGILSEHCERAGIPVVFWFVDDPRPIISAHADQIRPNMLAACWERAYLPWLKERGFGGVRYLPLASAPSLFDCASPPSPTVDIGFVGSSMGETFLAPMRQRFLWSPALEPVAERASEMLLNDRHAPPDECIAAALSVLGIQTPFDDERNRAWFRSYVVHTASMKRRRRMASSLLPEGLQLFGDPLGWQHLLPQATGATRPDIDYRTGLRDTYRTIAVNMNVTSCQMPTALNQRAFDVPLSSSFVLTDAQSDLFELFEPDEYGFYSSNEELVDKARFYLANPEARRAIAEAARTRVLAHHTYARRLQEIEEWVAGPATCRLKTKG